MAKKGEWVKIHDVILNPSDRAQSLPDDTKQVPFEMWLNGFLNHDAKIGEIVEITTLSGRKVKGTLVEINPRYTHDFGEPLPELLKIGPILKSMLEKRD
ncbi:MAG: 2-amino-4-ketopentanoate thiolase [Mesoaciditoga sp.]|uniref:2-amino-4-oxopentanoate thiolase subunit OrtA n=1 Tax=Athalassotoga sp. TaxID=2022597 RepID=UPI000CCA56CD|nr:MAG: 2-amino-4-ketopentanoate thiolase [Mesoaciditoga sp.]PMP79693.1 MAG: 2-amino-4-ketopentanoate thiolase [Mesoaciditoga sp.]HEU24359.1 2-amino-4-ketopentanoate thiolase [Mesoaciditoga lauensis]